MEFCSLRELQNQTGHDVWDWPLVVLKELLDNALDACEEVGVAPVVKVSVSPKAGTIVIDDNGPRNSRGDYPRGLRLHDPRLFARGLREPVSWRSRQCVEDHPRHGLRP